MVSSGDYVKKKKDQVVSFAILEILGKDNFDFRKI